MQCEITAFFSLGNSLGVRTSCWGRPGSGRRGYLEGRGRVQAKPLLAACSCPSGDRCPAASVGLGMVSLLVPTPVGDSYLGLPL